MYSSIKKIGIDLDNTIICYDSAFKIASKKFISKDEFCYLSKDDFRNQIRLKKDGEKEWQKIQGYVYGKGIADAEIFPGFYRFLCRCYQKKIKVEIVSHKTKYGHFDKNKTPLRNAASNFLESNNIINSGLQLIDNVIYTDNQFDKINYIKNNDFDLFIDDLIEVIDLLPNSKKNILFSPNGQSNSTCFKVATSWEDIENLLFGQLSTNDVKFMSNFLFKKVIIKDAIQLKGRGNSSVYKILTENNPIFLKFYPQFSNHNRLKSEFLGVKILNKLEFTEVQKPIACNDELNIAAYEWIDVDNSVVFDTNTIEKSLQFLRKLHNSRNNRLFNNFPMASDYCESVLDIENQIKFRLLQLQKCSIGYTDLDSFLKCDFIPVFDDVVYWSKLSLNEKCSYSNILDRKDMTLSPSDFGFHNILESKSGGIRFIDFEYFGWDDPVKLISDFSHHAAMNLTNEMENVWFEGVKDIYGESILNRLKASWPLYGLNWCLIILNEFKNDVWFNRCKANNKIKYNRNDILLNQLTKSRNKLKYISECYKDKEFW